MYDFSGCVTSACSFCSRGFGPPGGWLQYRPQTGLCYQVGTKSKFTERLRNVSRTDDFRHLTAFSSLRLTAEPLSPPPYPPPPDLLTAELTNTAEAMPIRHLSISALNNQLCFFFFFGFKSVNSSLRCDRLTPAKRSYVRH